MRQKHPKRGGGSEIQTLFVPGVNLLSGIKNVCNQNQELKFLTTGSRNSSVKCMKTTLELSICNSTVFIFVVRTSTESVHVHSLIKGNKVNFSLMATLF